MIGSFASGATASLVAKNGTNQLSQPFEDGFWCSRCLSDRIEVPDMMGSFASSATASLVAKNGAKQLYQPFEDGFWFSRCVNDHIKVTNMIGSLASATTASLVAKNGTQKFLHHCPKVDLWMLLFKRELKAPRSARRAPKPSTRAGRRGAKCPKLLVSDNLISYIHTYTLQ